MPLVLGADLGTTKITALAVDTCNGEVAACCTLPNQAETTAPADKSRSYSEWDARRIVETACACLRGVAEKLGIRVGETAGIGITGQQHGMIVVDETGQTCRRLVGAGNGLRENGVLPSLVGEAFCMPLSYPRHREEAAYGAALLAAVGAGLFPDLATAGDMIGYDA